MRRLLLPALLALCGGGGVCLAAAQQPPHGHWPTVERWRLHELAFTGPAQAGEHAASAGAQGQPNETVVVPNPFLVQSSAVFTEQDSSFKTMRSSKTMRVSGFFSGGTTYRLRMAPPTQSLWCWETSSSDPSSWGCVGTGKPCSKRQQGSFDLRRFNVSFFQNCERLLHGLNDINVVEDVIVFHPYDNGHGQQGVGSVSLQIPSPPPTPCPIETPNRGRAAFRHCYPRPDTGRSTASAAAT